MSPYHKSRTVHLYVPFSLCIRASKGFTVLQPDYIYIYCIYIYIRGVTIHVFILNHSVPNDSLD